MWRTGGETTSRAKKQSRRNRGPVKQHKTSLEESVREQLNTAKKENKKYGTIKNPGN